MPNYEHLSQMEKLGLIDLTNNSITEVNAFGKEINLTKVYLDYNQINKSTQQRMVTSADITTWNHSLVLTTS